MSEDLIGVGARGQMVVFGCEVGPWGDVFGSKRPIPFLLPPLPEKAFAVVFFFATCLLLLW